MMGGITVNTEKALVLAKASATTRIDTLADTLCANAVTTGLTQPTRYARKLAQAEAFLRDGAPTAEHYALIYNEVGLTASNAGGVAMAIVQAAESYAAYCDTVEAARMRAKAAVKAADSAVSVAAAEGATVWPAGR